MLISKVGASTSTDGPFISRSISGDPRLASGKLASISASGNDKSISPFGFFPFMPNLGRLKLGILKSRFPDGFSISISSFVSGRLMSASAFGFFPLKPNLGM